MRTVILEGSLGEQFGREFVLDIITPAQAVSALRFQLKGFEQALRDHPVGFHVRVGDEDRALEDLHGPSSRAETIRFIPAIAGSSANARIVVGSVLVAVGFMTSWTGVGAYAGGVGVSLLMGVAVEKLSPKPKTNQTTASQNVQGYAFSSGVNTTGQGAGIPLSFGTGLSGSRVVSAQIVSLTGVLYATADVGSTPAPPDNPAQNEGGAADSSAPESTTDGGDYGGAWSGPSWGYDPDNGWSFDDGTSVSSGPGSADGDASV